MPFPTTGSWISNIQTSPPTSGSTVLNFSANFTTGSSNVEYGVFNSTNTIELIPFTTASSGVNNIHINNYVNQDYRVHFRLIGYPSLGFAPKVETFSIQSGSVSAQLQTINLGSDILLSTTKFTKAKILTEGSYVWNLIGSVSSDGGSTWTPINTFGLEFSLTSTTGSECLIRLKDDSGSVVLDKLTAYFHTGDVI